jgi:hypothetical protein
MSYQRSSPDMLGLLAELNVRRIPMVFGTEQRKKREIVLGERELALLKLARRLHHRFRAGDYRHTDQEEGRILELCEILVRRYNQLHNLTDRPWQIDRSRLTSKKDTPEGTYEKCISGVMSGGSEW